jgi:hypothetical protein
MNIITSKRSLNTKNTAVVMVFYDDTELNDFITKLASIPVRTSGLRVLPLLPEGVELGPIQRMLMDIIEGIDGACGKDEKENKKIIDDTIGKLDKLLRDHG